MAKASNNAHRHSRELRHGGRGRRAYAEGIQEDLRNALLGEGPKLFNPWDSTKCVDDLPHPDEGLSGTEIIRIICTGAMVDEYDEDSDGGFEEPRIRRRQ